MVLPSGSATEVASHHVFALACNALHLFARHGDGTTLFARRHLSALALQSEAVLETAVTAPFDAQ